MSVLVCTIIAFDPYPVHDDEARSDLMMMNPLVSGVIAPHELHGIRDACRGVRESVHKGTKTDSDFSFRCSNYGTCQLSWGSWSRLFVSVGF